MTYTVPSIRAWYRHIVVRAELFDQIGQISILPSAVDSIDRLS